MNKDKDKEVDSLLDGEVSLQLRQRAYQAFVPGLRFDDFRRELARESWAFHKRSGGYMFVTRHTVLGRMRRRKEQLFHPWARLIEALSPEQKRQALRLFLNGRVSTEEALWDFTPHLFEEEEEIPF